MLKKSKRLNTSIFNNIIEKGQSFHGPFLIVRAKSVDSPSKFAVSVPKKVAKTAVLRNKIKRRVFDCLKEIIPNIKKNGNFIFIAKTGIEKLKYIQIKEEINKIFVKMDVLK